MHLAMPERARPVLRGVCELAAARVAPRGHERVLARGVAAVRSRESDGRRPACPGSGFREDCSATRLGDDTGTRPCSVSVAHAVDHTLRGGSSSMRLHPACVALCFSCRQWRLPEGPRIPRPRPSFPRGAISSASTCRPRQVRPARRGPARGRGPGPRGRQTLRGRVVPSGAGGGRRRVRPRAARGSPTPAAAPAAARQRRRGAWRASSPSSSTSSARRRRRTLARPRSSSRAARFRRAPSSPSSRSARGSGSSSRSPRTAPRCPPPSSGRRPASTRPGTRRRATRSTTTRRRRRSRCPRRQAAARPRHRRAVPGHGGADAPLHRLRHARGPGPGVAPAAPRDRARAVARAGPQVPPLLLRGARGAAGGRGAVPLDRERGQPGERRGLRVRRAGPARPRALGGDEAGARPGPREPPSPSRQTGRTTRPCRRGIDAPRTRRSDALRLNRQGVLGTSPRARAASSWPRRTTCGPGSSVSSRTCARTTTSATSRRTRRPTASGARSR